MRQDAQKHIAQDIVDKVFLELQHYDECTERTLKSKELNKIERRRKQLLKELGMLLIQSKKRG